MKSDDKRLKNLKPFKKGNPGGGRTHGALSFTTHIKKALSSKIDIASTAELVVANLIAKAMKGDIRAIKEILDRVEGKAKQTVGNTGELILRHEGALLELE